MLTLGGIKLKISCKKKFRPKTNESEVDGMKKEEQKDAHKTGWSRRTFLKVSAATAVATGVVASDPLGAGMKALAVAADEKIPAISKETT
jgi:hypothetical protein